MKLYFENDKSFIDSRKGIDLSIVIGAKSPKVKAWYLNDPEIKPVEGDGFVGSVKAGAPVNFRNIFFNPHAHGTHTEGLGHITKEVYSVNKIAHPLFYKTLVISILPEIKETETGKDQIITAEQIRNLELNSDVYEAIVIRTMPNSTDKLNIDYSHSNPCYFEAEGARLLREAGIMHLLVDLPSVDKEQDEGVLAFHHAFWNVPNSPDYERTITEFIFVPNDVEDGKYLLNMQVAPFENDASPSRPVLYKIFGQ